MLVGKSPFKANSFQEILDLNKLAKVNMDVKVLQANPLATDLIKKMTEVNPEKRYDAKQCLKHAFFNNKKDDAMILIEEKLKEVGKYKKQKKD